MRPTFLDRVVGVLIGLAVLAAGLVFTASLAVAALFVAALAFGARLLGPRRRSPPHVIDVQARAVDDAPPALEAERR